MEQNKEDAFDVALLLLFSAERLMVKRKVFEALHNGLAIGLVDNPVILMEIQKFLLEKSISERLQKLLKN